MKRSRKTVSMTADLFDRLAHHASEVGRPRAAVLTEVLTKYLDERGVPSIVPRAARGIGGRPHAPKVCPEGPVIVAWPPENCSPAGSWQLDEWRLATSIGTSTVEWTEATERRRASLRLGLRELARLADAPHQSLSSALRGGKRVSLDLAAAVDRALTAVEVAS